MAISVVGQASAAATSVAIPAHQAGDLIIVCARGTAAAPTVPTAGGTVPAWTTLQSGIANSIGLTVVAFNATAATTTTGAFTNATHICVLVLRPGAGNLLSTAAARSSVGNGNNTQTIIYPALTLLDTGGTSMGVRCGTRTVAITAVGTAPTNWTNQSIQPAGASALMSVHTRAALAANPTADTVTVTSSNAAYRAVTIEVQEVSLAQSKAVTGLVSPQAFGTIATAKGPVSRAVSGVVSAQAFGALGAVVAGPPQTVVVPGVYSPGFVPSIADAFVVDDGHVVDGSVAAQFGVPVVGGSVAATTVPVTGLGSAQAFGVLAPRTAITRAVGGVTSAQSFGVPVIRTAISKPTGGVPSAQAFGAPTLTVKGPLQTVAVLGVKPSGIVLLTASITAQVIAGDGHLVGSAAGTIIQFGAPRVSGTPSLAVTPVGCASAAAFGSLTIKTVVRQAVTGLGSAQSFGAPTVFRKGLPQTVQVPGLQPGTGYAFSITGQVTCGDGHLVLGGGGGLFGQVVIRPGGITRAVGGVTSAQTFGSLGAYAKQTVQVPGLQQFAGWGLSITGPVICGDGHLVLGGGRGLFGQVVIRAKGGAVVPGVSSAQRFGIVQPVQHQRLFLLFGCPSAAQFGKPEVFRAWVRQLPCVDFDLAAGDAIDVELTQLLCEHETTTTAICGLPLCGTEITGRGSVTFITPATAVDLDLVIPSVTDLDLQPVGCE